MRVFTCSSGPSRLLLGSDRPVCAIDLRNPHESASGTRAVPVQPSPASRQCLGAGLGPGPLGVWDKRIPLARLRVACITHLCSTSPDTEPLPDVSISILLGMVRWNALASARATASCSITAPEGGQKG